MGRNNKVRPQYVIDFVAKVNKHLRNHRITDENDTLFVFAHRYLMDKDMYNGYVFCKSAINKNGEEFSVLAGSCEKGKYEFLEFL